MVKVQRPSPTVVIELPEAVQIAESSVVMVGERPDETSIVGLKIR